MSIARRIVPLTLDNLPDIVDPCRTCLFWEVGPALGEDMVDELAELAKESWLSATLLDWGSCGKVAYVDGVAVGHALFAPPGFVARATAFPTSPVSGDAVLLMTVRVAAPWRSSGLGRMLAQAVAAELIPRGVKAIEAFGASGRTATAGRAATAGSGAATGQAAPTGSGASVGGGTGAAGVDRPAVFPASAAGCLMPADYLRSVGFKTVRPHPYFPRLRMELKSTVSWRYDVEFAIERILATAWGKQPVPVG